MIKNFTDADVTDQSGKTFFITGANTGLGFETALVLAEKGGRVLMGCRSEEKALAAMARIKEQASDADLKFVPLDQADLASVKAAAEIVQQEPQLDVLINNAGIMFPPLEYTADGFESQLGVNHLGTFALTAHLLPMLEKTDCSRVVITSSGAHKMGDIMFDDINAEKSYNKNQRYAQTKLANLLHMYELDRRLRAKGSKIMVTACHPGVATTELSRDFSWGFKLIFNFLAFNTAAQGAWPTLAAAVGEGATSGTYYGPKGFGEISGKAAVVKSTDRARDPGLAKKLWDLSVKMTGVDPAI